MRSMACIRLSAGLARSGPASTATAAAAARHLSTTSSIRFPAATLPRHADVGAAFGAAAAPPPPPPAAIDDDVRAAEARAARIERRQALAARLQADGAGKTAGSKRFYRQVQVADETEGLRILLDARPLRHPRTKAVLRLPRAKRLLAHALAVEWDALATVRQATQAHRVPLTSLVARAVDLDSDEFAGERAALIDQLLPFLDTDSVLCWAPPVPADTPAHHHDAQVRLRRAQEATAGPIMAHVAAHVWPGVPLGPVLGHEDDPHGHALFPRPHAPETRAAAAAWLRGLDGWALAGVERATLAGKSLVVAARLVATWQDTAAAAAAGGGGGGSSSLDPPFTADDAVRATSLETAVQTEQWGAVEDTHDVDDADLRRHFGSVVLLVA